MNNKQAKALRRMFKHPEDYQMAKGIHTQRPASKQDLSGHREIHKDEVNTRREKYGH